MSFYELCKERYSVRKFKPEHIKQDDLDYILQCGRIAPTACNFQPQRVLVFNTDEDCAKLALTGASQSNAPAGLLLCYDKNKAWVRKPDGTCSGHVDTAIVQTHMMLAAAERGVGSVYVMAFDPVKVRDVLQLPDNYEPVSFLMMGYPAEDAAPSPMHDQKLAENETIFYGTFEA